MKTAKLYKPNKITIENVPEPQIKRDCDVKIKVHYCGINSDDWLMYSGKINARYPDYGLLNEFSGVIVELGEKAKAGNLRVGDHVSAIRFSPCGNCPMCRSGHGELCVELNGTPALSEYIVTDCKKVVKLPPNLPLEQGVLFWPAACCFEALDRLKLEAGESMLIHGAGTMGLLMLQLAKARFASPVVVSEPILGKRTLALILGADHVINPASDDFSECTLEKTEGFGFNVIIDSSSNTSVFPNTVNLLSRGGRLMLFSNYPQGTKFNIDLGELIWKNYTITSCYGPNYTSYTFNPSFLSNLKLSSLIGPIFALDKADEAFESYATHMYQKILIKM